MDSRAYRQVAHEFAAVASVAYRRPEDRPPYVLARAADLGIGELALARTPRGPDYGVATEARFETGVWVGWRWGTPTNLFSNGTEAIKCRAVRRVPAAGRWGREVLDAVCGTRWVNPPPAPGAVAVPAVSPGLGELAPPSVPAR